MSTHEERVKKRIEHKESILNQDPSDFRIGNCLCKDHNRWFVYSGDREIVTCACKVVDVYANHNYLGDMLIKATATIHSIRAELSAVKKERDGMRCCGNCGNDDVFVAFGCEHYYMCSHGRGQGISMWKPRKGQL